MSCIKDIDQSSDSEDDLPLSTMLLQRVTAREKANPTDEQLETPRTQDPETQPKVYHELQSVSSLYNAHFEKRKQWYGFEKTSIVIRPDEEREGDGSDKDPDYLPSEEDDSQSDGDSIEKDINCSIDNVSSEVFEPTKEKSSEEPNKCPRLLHSSEFVVEGEPREEIEDSEQEKTQPQCKERQARKRKRNHGMEYRTESGKLFKNKGVKEPCDVEVCKKRGLSCHRFSQKLRSDINGGFYQSGQLADQRRWLLSYVDVQKPKRTKNTSRKGRTMKYHLPFEKEKVQVCRKMFLNTVGIDERQVRTALSKVREDGQMEPEGRGGRRVQDQIKDDLKRQSIKEHISEFPKMESHYCRAMSKHEFLAPDLSIQKMYDMYCEKQKQRNETPASKSLYKNVFSSLRLKFYTLKKDACGICLTKMKNPEQNEEFQEVYEKHIAEKTKVREIKEDSKKKAIENPKLSAAVFDLQQVIYLPKSNHSSLFYKRRLANFNFTIYELGSGKGHCYLWHEGIAKRGANEIATCIFSFIKEKDAEGKEEIVFFCDGCIGQNKNSIVSAMLLYALEKSQSLMKMTVCYFETNHGQSEGDSMHLVIERKVSKQPELYHPSQLATLIQSARASGKQPYRVHVVQMNTHDILDWKEHGQKVLGINNWRETDDGRVIQWPNVMEVSVKKEDGKCELYFKNSHNEAKPSKLNKRVKRSRSSDQQNISVLPKPAYTPPPNMSFEKYKDLMSMCSGRNAVITHQDHVSFYKGLPHNEI
ncbi:DNA repair protein rhp54 [Elysia marginata]|uniref:DNA repair protein rhp54 n=1 Tax=Elysia marginata TaxID=1093978 RepID=A0AAV4HV36_9GAST|nr:DNA repair protein rhp54 [Elysia marginata]